MVGFTTVEVNPLSEFSVKTKLPVLSWDGHVGGVPGRFDALSISIVRVVAHWRHFLGLAGC